MTGVVMYKEKTDIHVFKNFVKIMLLTFFKMPTFFLNILKKVFTKPSQECSQQLPKFHGERMNGLEIYKGQTDIHAILYIEDTII